MTKVDDMIRSALKDQEKELFDQLDSDMSLHEMTAAVYRGKMRWISVMTTLWMLVFFVLAIICAWQFFQTDVLSELVMWATGFGFCIMTVTMMKIWFWMEMQKAAILREVKRVELQILDLRRCLSKPATSE